MSLDTFLQSNSTELLYPNIRPTLNLNFAKAKTLDPRITFSRNSIGSYVDSDGLIKYASANQPRFDHDPITGTCKGLLIEEQRSNLTLYSDTLIGGNWSTPFSDSNISIRSNATLSPYNTLNATLMTLLSSGSGYHSYYGGSLGESVGDRYTFSVYVKSNGSTNVRIVVDNAYSQGSSTFSLSDGGLLLSGNGTIQRFLNGWFRITTTATLSIANTAPAVSCSGKSGDGIYIWGAQLEKGSFSTSYIPTLGSTVTRAADNASITGNNFSSWFSQNGEFSIYLEFLGYQTDSLYSALLYFSGQDLITRSFAGTNLTWQNAFSLVYASLGISNLNSTTVRQKIFGALENNTFILANSSTVNSKSTSQYGGTFTFKSQSSINFGINCSTTLARITYYPKRLPNSQLQLLAK